MTTDALFELPPRLREIQARAHDVAQRVRPWVAQVGATDGFVPQIRAELAASGLSALMVPARHGGLLEQVDSLAVTITREQLAAVCGQLDSMFAMQGIGSFALTRAGTPDLQQAWLPRIGRLEAIAGLALTEPDIGSDLKALTTSVRAEGGHLVLDGVKSFITNAGVADVYAVLGREGDASSLVLVPADTLGLSIEHPHRVIDHHLIGDVVLDSVRVPADHRIGSAGMGFELVLATLATFRASVAGASLGLAQRALDLAARHARGREMFGTTLDRLGGVQQALATCWVEVEMARSLTYRAAAAAATDPMANLHLSSMAKVGATEVAGRVVDRAVQVMGRFGLLQDSEIDRLVREVRPMRIYEGSTEVILDSLARQLMKRVVT